MWQGLFGFYFQNLMVKVQEEQRQGRKSINKEFPRFSATKQFMPSSTFYSIMKVLLLGDGQVFH